MPKMKDPSASTPAILRWEKPNQGWMKLNVDGSFDASSGKGCISAVLRNSQGEVIFSACGFLDRCSGPLEAELLACKEGINMALQWTLLPIVVELDCSVAVKLISSVSKGRSEVAFIVRDRSGVYRQRHQTVDVWEQGDYYQEDTP
jgi:ribonuclease HI